jgi:hypothetical protein
MISSAGCRRAGGIAGLAILAACTGTTYRGFDGGPCTWNFPADDPCAASGLICRHGPLGSQGGTTCQLPGELFRCSPQYGCATPYLSCVEVPVDGLGSVPLCVRSCAKAGISSDCPNPFSFCQPLPDGGGNACQLASCIGAYQLAPCQVGDSAPGTCLPQALGSTQLSFCQAPGPVQPGDSCSTGGSYQPLCAQGSVCVSQQCFTVCERSVAPNCPSGKVCSPPYVVNQSAAFFDGIYSFCLTPCSLDAGVGCTAPQTCYEPPGQQGFCVP